MRKKCLVLGVTACLAMSLLSGCSSNSSSSSSSSDAAESTDSSEEAVSDVDPSDYKLGASIMTIENTFQVLQGNAMEAAAEEIGFSITVSDGQSSSITQQESLANFLSQGCDANIIIPVDPGVADEMVATSQEDDVPIVFLNSEPDHDVVESWEKCFYVGCVASDAGTMEGELIYDYFENVEGADKNGDGVIQMVLMWGQKDIADAIARSTYSVQYLEEMGYEVEIISEPVCSSWSKQESYEACVSIISSIGAENIEVFCCNNDDIALGAVEALKAVGYNTGESQDPSCFVPVVGVDAVDSAIEAVAEGSMLGTVKQDGVTMGQTAAKVAYYMATGIFDGDELAELVGVSCDSGNYFWVDYQKISADNVADYQ